LKDWRPREERGRREVEEGEEGGKGVDWGEKRKWDEESKSQKNHPPFYTILLHPFISSSYAEYRDRIDTEKGKSSIG